uniref:Corin, serine peptidase n=1 Tax=Paramormyrops kingsleyae TaxID=1676925 RepID=A0A3B3TE74_9TELE
MRTIWGTFALKSWDQSGTIGNGVLQSGETHPLPASKEAPGTDLPLTGFSLGPQASPAGPDRSTRDPITQGMGHLKPRSRNSSSPTFRPPTLTATPDVPTTAVPSWVTSLSTLSPLWSDTTPQAMDLNMDKDVCSDISQSQCHMLPYNRTSVFSRRVIVKSVEVDMFLKFFSYLNRLSCYRHIMLFGCSLALPECVTEGEESSATSLQPETVAVLCATARDTSRASPVSNSDAVSRMNGLVLLHIRV